MFQLPMDVALLREIENQWNKFKCQFQIIKIILKQGWKRQLGL